MLSVISSLIEFRVMQIPHEVAQIEYLFAFANLTAQKLPPKELSHLGLIYVSKFSSSISNKTNIHWYDISLENHLATIVC